MGTVTIAQGAASLANFLIGGTTSAGDAANSANQALSASTTSAKMINTVAATADVAGTGASSLQMFQQFIADSSEAGILAGDVAKFSGQLSLYAAVAIINGHCDVQRFWQCNRRPVKRVGWNHCGIRHSVCGCAGSCDRFRRTRGRFDSLWLVKASE